MSAFIAILVTALTGFAMPAAFPVVPLSACLMTYITYRQGRRLYGDVYALGDHGRAFARGILLQSFCHGLAASGAAYLLGAMLHVTMIAS